MAGGLGFEPRPAGPEPAVLPIRRSPSAKKNDSRSFLPVKASSVRRGYSMGSPEAFQAIIPPARFPTRSNPARLRRLAANDPLHP